MNAGVRPVSSENKMEDRINQLKEKLRNEFAEWNDSVGVWQVKDSRYFEMESFIDQAVDEAVELVKESE